MNPIAKVVAIWISKIIRNDINIHGTKRTLVTVLVVMVSGSTGRLVHSAQVYFYPFIYVDVVHNFLKPKPLQFKIQVQQIHASRSYLHLNLCWNSESLGADDIFSMLATQVLKFTKHQNFLCSVYFRSKCSGATNPVQ